MWPIGMTCDLGLLPRRQVSVRVHQQSAGLGFQLGDFLADICVARISEVAQLPDLALEFSDRLFEVEKRFHPAASYTFTLQAEDLRRAVFSPLARSRDPICRAFFTMT